MYEFDEKRMNNKKASSLNTIIIAILIIIGIVICYVMFIKNEELSSDYENTENELVEKAKDFVKKNNILTSQEIYLDVTKIGASIPKECSLLSGVIYNGSSYKPYLYCKNYESKIINNTQSDKLALKGKEIEVISKNVNYYDEGYQSNENVITTGEVLQEEGIYNLYYSLEGTSIMLMRKVIVIDNSVVNSLFPSISLNGDANVNVVVGSSYNELGVKAYDSIDGDISSKVSVNKSVNINQVSQYILKYTITNSRGYSNFIQRIVNVVDSISSLNVSYEVIPSTQTNSNVTIKFNVIGDKYAYTMLPNNTKNTLSSFNYEVTENGTYKFTIYDSLGRSIEKGVIVSNIDKTLPTATCTAIMYSNRTEVTVYNTSSKPISEYEYILDNENKVLNQNTYTSSKIKPNLVSVKIKDNIGNISVVNCNIINKSTPEIYIDNNGKRCLEGYTCFVQSDWDSGSYYFCSDSARKSCGTIAGHGCSIVSFATAVSKLNVKSKNGTPHTPYTLLNEIYNGTGISKNGYCDSGCSGWEAIKKAARALGLTTPEKAIEFNKNTINEFKDYLRRGYVVMVNVYPGIYSDGKHIIAVLGIRDDDYVYIYNTNAGSSNISSFDSRYKQNDWVPINDLLTVGQVNSFFPIGTSSN